MAQDSDYIRPSTWKLFRKNFRFSSHFHCHPYTWDVRKSSAETPTALTVTCHRWKLALWYFNLTLALIHYAFLQFRTIKFQLDPNSSVVERVYMQIMIFLYLSLNLAHVTNIAHRQGVTQFLNKHVTLVNGAYKGRAMTFAGKLYRIDQRSYS